MMEEGGIEVFFNRVNVDARFRTRQQAEATFPKCPHIVKSPSLLLAVIDNSRANFLDVDALFAIFQASRSTLGRNTPTPSVVPKASFALQLHLGVHRASLIFHLLHPNFTLNSITTRILTWTSISTIPTRIPTWTSISTIPLLTHYRKLMESRLRNFIHSSMVFLLIVPLSRSKHYSTF
jgi:hypothetical protein